MKENKGVTLIAVIITIIVIIILAVITIFYGLYKNGEKAIETKSVYEVFSVLDAAVNRTLLNRLNPTYYAFIGDTTFGSKTIDGKEYRSDNGWYLLGNDDIKELGVDNVKGEFLVNYVDGLVVSISPITYKGVEYYSLNDLKKEMGGAVTMVANVEYDELKGVNKPILSNGMVPVKISGSDWVVAAVNDEGWYDYSKDQMAWANVMLKDELTLEDSSGKVYSNAEVRSMSLDELTGKKVKTEGSSYVWIPRYTATSLGETGSEIVFSNLTNDTTSANGKVYTLPDAFTYSENGERLDLPGIWVSKYEASFDR